MKKTIHTNTKGFTLVELIVVITILSILGTISFISIQGISADARDAKRGSDLSNIIKAMEISMIKGVDITSFVDGTGSTITYAGTGASTSTGARIRISGVEGYPALSNNYFGGDINYTALGIKKSDFSDPLKTTEAYKIGVTNYNSDLYEVAATIENGGSPKALIMGTWNARSGRSFSGNITNGSDTFVFSGMLSIESGLRAQDVIEFTSTGGLYTITKVNQDTIQITPAWSGSVSNSVHLNSNESTHIIKRWGTRIDFDNYKIDPNNGLTGSPYQIN